MFVIENRPASLSAPLWHTASWLEALKSHLYWENVEDSPPRLAGELASYKFHKHIYQLLSHLETKPPLRALKQSGRSSAAQSLPVSLPSLLWRNKTEAVGEGGDTPLLTSRLWSLGSLSAVDTQPPLCRVLTPSPCWATFQPPQSTELTQALEVLSRKTTGPPRQHISEGKTTEIFCSNINTASTFKTSKEWHYLC